MSPTTSQPNTYAAIAIPLSRPEVVDFLLSASATPRGAKLQVLGQRPSPQAEAAWLAQLTAAPQPTAAGWLAIDDPHGHLIETHTDRLVTVEELAQPNFLTRDLGGWVANYFGVAGLPQQEQWPADPLLKHAEILTDYGPRIKYFGGDPALVQRRLEEETGGDLPFVVAALARLHRIRRELSGDAFAAIERVYAELATDNRFAGDGEPAIPAVLLVDELAGQMVRLELARRAALARHDDDTAERIAAWQQRHQQESGLRLILQGEYIVGRHRRSTVLIAPELGVVIKQPGLEPLHEIELQARFVQGRHENWPYTTHDGAVVTSRGRVRLTVEENLVPRLNRVFGHSVQFSTLMGLSIEPFVVGKTVQELVLGDHSQLTPQLYEEIVLHQQVCEAMGIENGDWHAPNFVQRAADGQIVHIDWGAARPLRPDELTPEGRLSRINQVSNMAFSFKDPELAVKLKGIHADLLADESRMAGLRRRAEAMAKKQ
ncbi:MAG: hypothetical protein Kow0031_26660 [Anaerolineae bacterium]